MAKSHKKNNELGKSRKSLKKGAGWFSSSSNSSDDTKIQDEECKRILTDVYGYSDNYGRSVMSSDAKIKRKNALIKYANENEPESCQRDINRLNITRGQTMGKTSYDKMSDMTKSAKKSMSETGTYLGEKSKQTGQYASTVGSKGIKAASRGPQLTYLVSGLPIDNYYNFMDNLRALSLVNPQQLRGQFGITDNDFNMIKQKTFVYGDRKEGGKKNKKYTKRNNRK